MKNFNEYITEQIENTSLYQIGRSKKNTIKVVDLGNDVYRVIYTENGGQFNKVGDIETVIDFCSDMIVVGGGTYDTLLKKIKLISGDDVFRTFLINKYPYLK